MNKIKLLRSKRGISQGKLAEEAKVGVVTIIRLESGGKAYPATLIKLAEALGVELDELLEFEASGPYKGKAKPPPKLKQDKGSNNHDYIPTPPPLPEQPPQEPVKFSFTGQNKDYGWAIKRELGLTISQVKGVMMKLPNLKGMSYEDLRKAVAEKFKKEI